MNNKTVLVIDDSATIRRLCDGELSSAGYRVLLAPTAEEGVATAVEKSPDLIILDHQLPGTTGYEVCCQLLQAGETEKIPVVASSTLRKKAYAEYLDCDNVVDMLPKPYTPEALIATVENAINTAEMVVQSQCDGSSVPEVIDELGECALSGAFGCFGMREILDLINNGRKTGVLEVEAKGFRIFVFVDRGRIQAITGSGIDHQQVAQYMPESLSELSPVIKLTVAGRRGSEIDGLVELLNNKVLDPRLLKKLLRLQAAVLLRKCFTEEPLSFRFDPNQVAPPLFLKLPLDASLLALLVEGALTCFANELPQPETGLGFVRRTLRGQNLDRAGLLSRHMRLMSVIAEPASIVQMSEQLGWPEEETQRVVHGFELAELIERRAVTNTTKVLCMVKDPELKKQASSFFKSARNEVSPKFVNDLLGLKLSLRRSRPDVLLLDLSAGSLDMTELASDASYRLDNVSVVLFQNEEQDVAQNESSANTHHIVGYESIAQELRQYILGDDLDLETDNASDSQAEALSTDHYSNQSQSDSSALPAAVLQAINERISGPESTSSARVSTNVEG